MTLATRRMLPVLTLSLTVSGMLAPFASAGDARALTDSSQVLIVGNWTLDILDGGVEMRIPDDESLGWEIRDGDGILQAQGVVPGSEGRGVDSAPALSRSPLNGEVWLAWSRQSMPGASREIVLQRFNGVGWTAGSLVPIASDIDDQIDPSLIHDEGGTAWLAWIDGVNDRNVRFAGVAPDGRMLGVRSLSDGISMQNGPPTIGIDAVGKLFVAHAGTPLAGGDVSLFVQTPNPGRVGITHLPDPIIEFGLRGTIPAPQIGLQASGIHLVPSRVHLTVLGGTPVAWWTETENGHVARFRYAAEASGDWSRAELRTLNLQTGTVATIPDALALIEARLRRVIPQAPGTREPVTPPLRPGLGRLESVR